MKISIFFQAVKYDLGVKTADAYSIHCKCGQICLGQKGYSIGNQGMPLTYPSTVII